MQPNVSHGLFEAFLTNTSLQDMTRAAVCEECTKIFFLFSFFKLNYELDVAADELRRSSKDRKHFSTNPRMQLPICGSTKALSVVSSCRGMVFFPSWLTSASLHESRQRDCQYLHMGHHRFIIWPIAHPCYTGSMCFLAERNRVMRLFILLAAEVNKQAGPKASS